MHTQDTSQADRPSFWRMVVHHIRLWFHWVSNIHPCIWIGAYFVMIPIFALFYWWMPTEWFHVPENGGYSYGSWLYYSTVTISTLGFGDYTPAHGWAQATTAIEVLCGLSIFGFFLNAVSAMKTDLDVEGELERQRQIHLRAEKVKLEKSTPMVLHVINTYIDRCSTVEKSPSPEKLNAVLKAAAMASLALDSLQSRIDLTLWPQLMDDCFSFVANYQLLAADAEPQMTALDASGKPSADMQNFMDHSLLFARSIETQLTEDSQDEEQKS